MYRESVANTDRRQSILKAAERLVRRDGLAAASVRAVAAEAGIGASTLRHYFPQQHVLYEAIVERMRAGAVSDMRIHDTSLDPATRLTECLMQLLPPDDDSLPLLVPYIDTLSAAFGTAAEPKIRQAYLDLADESTAQQRTWLAQLESEGRLRAPAPELLPLLHTIVDGLAVQLLTRQDDVKVADARSQLNTLLRGAVVS